MNFKEFFQLYYESVTLSVADSDRESSTLGDLTHELNSLFHKFMLSNGFSMDNYPNELRGEQVVVDGESDYFGKEGIISVYTGAVPEQLTNKLINMLKYYIGEHNGEVTGRPYVETSGSRKGDVWRIRVKMDDAQDNPPDLNMSNVNARLLLCDILNYPSDIMTEYPSINAKELLMKIEQIEDNDYILTKSVRKTTQQGNNISFGLSKEQIKQRLDQLKKVCEWAIERDFTFIQLS